jgi:hypothetical protein
MSARKLDKLLGNRTGGNLGKIIQRAQKMDVLTSALKQSLDSDLADNLVAANVREDGELVVICSGSAWASRLRFEAETLLKAARNAGETPVSCRVRVARPSQESGGFSISGG